MKRIGQHIIIVLATLLVGFGGTRALAQEEAEHQQHEHKPPVKNFLSQPAREALSRLMVQDFRGRMKPLDTLCRESIWKISKTASIEEWEPVDLYLSWMAHPDYWFEKPIVAVRHPDLRSMLQVREGDKCVTPASLYDASGNYKLAADVDKAQRTSDKSKSKMQRKLISLDERFNLFHMTFRGHTLRLFPLPGDENNRWLSSAELEEQISGEQQKTYQAAYADFQHALVDQDNAAILNAVQAIESFQQQYGASVLPSQRALNAELQLNRLQPFMWATIPYLIAFGLLILAYGISLAKSQIRPISFRNPLYSLGMVVFVLTVLYHTYAYILRWIAGGHAPLSNGYESLIFIALMIGVAGIFYEVRSRRASMAALAALLACVILGVAMLPTFDAAISPLVPVLSSFWLIVHVTIITASYGYLGLGALIAMAMLIMYLFKRPGRITLQVAIGELNRLQWNVVITGLAFLSVGTFLGGVWANESWGRYWGWDPKETWALVTILVYAFVVHLRFIPSLNNPLNLAAGNFLAIWTVGMTYFGVNYFLAGLHSYAQGQSPGVPGWVYVMAAIMIVLVFAAYMMDSAKRWDLPKKAGGRPRKKKKPPRQQTAARTT